MASYEESSLAERQRYDNTLREAERMGSLAAMQEEQRRRRMMELQSDPNVQSFLARERELKEQQQAFQRNPKLQEQFMLEREKSRLRKDELAAKPVIPKPLSIPLQKQLSEGAELVDATQRFVTTFKDEFGGKTLTGGLGNVIGKTFGDSSGQSQWWQDYELHQSQIRNKLFGSALTASEIEAWNKSAINPRMDSGEIRKNLTRRNQLEQTGLERLVKGAAAGGYNKEQIEAFTGRSAVSKPSTPDYIEVRTTKDGRKLGKKADGTIEEVK